MHTGPMTLFVCLLGITGMLLFSGCSGGGGDASSSGGSHGGGGETSQPHTSVSSIIISGTTDRACTVVVDARSDSDPSPTAFSITIPIVDPDSGSATHSLLVEATDADMNSSARAIDLTMTK